MKLYVPRIGDTIALLEDWHFSLFNEERNATAMQVLGDTRPVMNRWNTSFTGIPAVIPKGEVLKIDRIYIRKGQEDFDSMTFIWVGKRTAGGMEACSWNPSRMIKKSARAARFWAKMDDVNTIEFDHI